MKPKINEIEQSAVEEKITTMLLTHRKDLTIEEAERLAKWAVKNPMKVIFGTKEEIFDQFMKDSGVVLN